MIRRSSGVQAHHADRYGPANYLPFKFAVQKEFLSTINFFHINSYIKTIVYLQMRGEQMYRTITKKNLKALKMALSAGLLEERSLLPEG